MDIFSEDQDEIDTRRGNKYFHIAKELKRRIDAGEIQSRLPSQPQICEEFSTTPVTAHKAIRLLNEAGLVNSTKGRGTFVTRLKRPRTNVIEAILQGPPSESPLHVSFSQGFHAACAKNGQRGVITFHAGDPKKSVSLVREAWKSRAVDGFVLWPAEARNGKADPAVKLMQEEGIPFVLVPHPDPELYGACHQVASEQLTVAEALMAHLLRQGHSRIAFVAWRGFEKTSFGKARYQAYQHMMKASGHKPLPPLRFNATHISHMDINTEGVSPEILKTFTAAFCLTDLVALHVCRICLESGIRVPGDLQLTGYDNTAGSLILNFSSVDQRFDRIAEQAARLLLREINGELDQPIIETVKARAVIH